jgi:putative transposase
MANTYTQIYIHAVFWIHENYLDESFSAELYSYIGGVLKAKGHKPLAIGGTSNHIHILFGLNPVQSISDLLRDVKSNSSRFLKEKRYIRCRFKWQEGYGGFSYSRSQITRVINYINNQKEHHKKKTFKEEYLEMLKTSGIEFDERYFY